jgi:hypothetical protein
MGKILTSVVFCLLILQVNAQKQLPKNRFGLLKATKEYQEEVQKVPYQKVKLLNGTKDNGEKAMPTFIDNSLYKYFPPIVSQISNSCGCASNVHYIFTYEVNRLLNRDGKDPENIFNYMQIWNFLNEGVARGTQTTDVLNMINSNGAIPESIYKTSSITEWINGYNKYFSGMSYKIKSYNKFDPSKSGGLEAMKQYLIDRGNGSKHGGLIQFSAFADPLKATNYRESSDAGLKSIIPEFGTDGMHSMTIAGFDDSVWSDYNNDGTKDKEEMGAFICINSWGLQWGDKGKFYAPYYTFTTLEQGKGGTGNGGKDCFVMTPEVRDVKMALKIKVSHSSRNDLTFQVGVSKNKDAKGPSFIKDFFPVTNKGGDIYMRGDYQKDGTPPSDIYKTIEMGIDITDLCNMIGEERFPTFFINIKDENEGNPGEGEIVYCTLTDYRTNPATEYIAEIENSELSPRKGKLVKINTQPRVDLKLDKDIIGVDTHVKGNTLNLFIKSNTPTKADAKIINKNGIVVATIFENRIVNNETIEWKSTNAMPGKYIVRVSTDDQVICEIIEIK